MVFLRPMKASLPAPGTALAGRDTPVRVADRHAVLGTPLVGPWPPEARTAVFGLGCFWGAERLFWTLPGVISTSVGYAGGDTRNPTYEEVCSGGTGHAEVVRVVYDPDEIGYLDLLKVFWENHDPTQGMRQGNDVGTQYRSAIYTTDPGQLTMARESRDAFAPVVAHAGYQEITTEIRELGDYFYAEDYHQQYLARHKNGYCGIGPSGLTCPVGVARG